MSHLTKIITFALLSTTSFAVAAPIAVYNQAYIENQKPDEFVDIIANAKNAYVLVDPYETDVEIFVKDIKANGNQIGAYISIGTGEDWRDDFIKMQPYLVKQAWEQWQGEFFVSSTEPALVQLMQTRIDEIATIGADWVEFDNMDWAFDDKLRKKHGFKVTQAQSITYFQQLCDYVHSKGMKCMSKNLSENIDNFDGVTFESYEIEKNWWDVDAAQAFLKTGKLFIVNHYNSPTCDAVFEEYKKIYSDQISFICEDSNLKKYVHYNP